MVRRDCVDLAGISLGDHMEQKLMEMRQPVRVKWKLGSISFNFIHDEEILGKTFYFLEAIQL